MFAIKIERYIVVQSIIGACLSFGEILVGYGTAWTAPILPMLDDPKQSPLPYAVTEGQKSLITSLMFVGACGVYIGGYLSNLIGRKKTLIIAGVFCFISFVLITAAKNLVMICLGRVSWGLSTGVVVMIGIIYMGEIASPNIRGIIMTCVGVFHALGTLLVYCVGSVASYAGVGYVGIGLSIVYTGACCFLPESPVYHVLKDDEKSASKVLEYLGRSTDIQIELKHMIENIRQRQSQKHILRELFSLKSNRKSLFISLSLSFFQYSSGVIAVLVYATTIFKLAGSSVKPEVATIITGVTFVLGTAITPMFIEKYGRRILLLVSTAGCCVTMALMGLYFYLRETNPQSVESVEWMPLVLLILAQLSYSVGLSIIPNTITGELFTSKVRALGTSATLTAAWLSGLVSTAMFGPLQAAAGVYTAFWLFAVIDGFAFAFTLLFVPETKGKSLMEIEEMLS